jgi:hypothetical protein
LGQVKPLEESTASSLELTGVFDTDASSVFGKKTVRIKNQSNCNNLACELAVHQGFFPSSPEAFTAFGPSFIAIFLLSRC